MPRCFVVVCSLFALACLTLSCSPSAALPAVTAADLAHLPEAAVIDQPIPSFNHIFIIVIENTTYDQVLEGKDAPYLSSLAKQYGLATNYYAIAHPSLPNYLALIGGSTFGIDKDCNSCFVNETNLVDQLELAGRSWKGYMESMPNPCFLGDVTDIYRQKHNPFVYFDNVRTNPERCNKIVPFTQFDTDLQANALPNFVWITPNMCNDAHNCPLSSSDTWLKMWVSKIIESPAWKENGVLFITFDEADKPAGESAATEQNGGHIATVVLSPLGKPAYQSATAYTHYSLLRTIEAAWGLKALGDAQHAQPMAEFFTVSLK